MPEKEKYTLEYMLRTSEKILYARLSTTSGLSEWFSENVDINNDIYTFSWEGYGEDAKLVSKKANDFIKFQWVEDEGTPYYLEFKISIDPLTNDLALIITDFAEPDELEEAKLLWDKQISDLIRIIGA